MLGVDRRSVQNFDWMLFGLVVILTSAGMVNLISATHTGSGLSEAVHRQLISVAVGGVALIVTMAIDYRHYERLAFPIFALSLLMLAATLVFGVVTRGSQSWLFEGRVQPAEVAKLGMILVLARHFNRHPPGEIRSLRGLIQPGLLVALPTGLILLQRDMGVALLVALIGSTYLAFVRIQKRAWLGVALLGVVALVTAWFYVFEPYQRERILDVIDPGRDPLASGYQVNQSNIAIGSGGLLGKGYLEGTQTQLRFLPTQHTDFAFSVLAEEWGFVGASCVLSLYVMMLLWGLVVAKNSKDGFGTMLALGVTGMLFWPAVLNVGMVLGLAPVIGVPLPLFAYGGSSMVTALIGIGLLMNVSLRRYVF